MLKFKYPRVKDDLDDESNQRATEMDKDGDVKHYSDKLESPNEASEKVVTLAKRVKVLEIKMAILEPQYMINGKRHYEHNTRWEAFKEKIRRAFLLTSGHGKLILKNL